MCPGSGEGPGSTAACDSIWSGQSTPMLGPSVAAGNEVTRDGACFCPLVALMENISVSGLHIGATPREHVLSGPNEDSIRGFSRTES